MSAEVPESLPLVVGIDGGGTRTRVILADASGTVLAKTEGAGTALTPGYESDAADIIKALIGDVLATANRADTRPAAGALHRG